MRERERERENGDGVFVFSVFWYGEQQASKQVRNRKQDKEG
jgi:hypothetical protein